MTAKEKYYKKLNLRLSGELKEIAVSYDNLLKKSNDLYLQINELMNANSVLKKHLGLSCEQIDKLIQVSENEQKNISMFNSILKTAGHCW